MSLALWVPVIWYALEASRSVSRWLSLLGYSIAGPDDLEGSPVDRAVYSALMGLGLAILYSRKVNWKILRRNNAWLFALFLYMLISVVWSDYPGVSFKRWTRSFADVVMALIVLTECDSFEGLYTVLRRVLCIAMPLSIILIKYYRDIGTAWDYLGNEMWVGVTTHKNVLGQVAMIAGLYFLTEIMRKWRSKSWRSMSVWIYLLFLFMTLWVLRGSPSSRSTTSAALFLIGALLLTAFNYLRSKAAYIRRYLVLGVFLVSVLFLALTALSDQSLIDTALGASGRDSSLTGRTDLWTDLLRIASDNPILGVGYGSFWIGNTHGLWDIHIWGPTQGHNGYLDVYVELGIIGLLILGGLIVSAYRSILSEFTRNYDIAALRLTILTLIICHNFTESSFLRGTVDLWFIFLVVVIDIPSRFESGKLQQA